MKKYFLNDGTGQQGPFSLEELKEKNITADTAIWYDGLPEWTTAGKLEELKDILPHTPPPFNTPAPEVKPAPVVTETVATATTAASVTPVATPVTSSKKPVTKNKKTAWLSWVLYLLVFGAVGYFIYQDMEKNKGNTTTSVNSTSENTGNASVAQPDSAAKTSESHAVVVTNEEAAKTETATADVPVSTTTTTTTAETNQPPVSNTTKTNQPVAVNEKAKPTTTTMTKAQQAEAQKLAQKKIDEEKKKLQAAQAAQAAAVAAKEKEYRNNWSKYVTIGKLDIKKDNDDGVEAFNVPVYNGTNATLDKVTVRIDYMKKEKKIIKSETIMVYGIPPGGGLNGRAPESKKGNNIKVNIIGISSRRLHFCFPENNGNASDPYFCN